MKHLLFSILVLFSFTLFSQQGQVDNLMSEIAIQYQAKPVGKDSIDLSQVVFNPNSKPLSKSIVVYETMSKDDLKKMISGTLAQQDSLISNMIKAMDQLEKDQETIRKEYDLYPKKLAAQMDQVIDRKNAIYKEIGLSRKIINELKNLKL